MPGVWVNIYHILVLVRLGERKVYREGMLFNRVHRVPSRGLCHCISREAS